MVVSHAQEVTRNFTTLSYNKVLQNQSNNLTEGTNSSQLISQTEQQTAEIVRLLSNFEEKTIPVVFHILHANETQKVSTERVQAQLTALNDHFSLSSVIENHPNDTDGIYASRAVDTKIRFCLATQDANGGAIEGINYVATSIPEWSTIEGIKQSDNGTVAITPDGILNIWVAALPVENGGYAQMPNRGDLATDGVVINYRYFGNVTDTNYGFKSLTFLVGQYLNLYPLSGYSEDIPCSDDYVSDTPISNGTNSGCPSGNHVSLCEYQKGQLVPEMVMCFMSPNTSDDCKYMFTRGQTARMHALLDSTGVRYGLVQGTTLCSSENIADARNSKSTTDKLTASTLNVYPNPATSSVTIEVENLTPHTIEILTSDGKQVFFQSLPDREQGLSRTIDISSLSAGFYLVKVQADQTSLVQKLTIE